VAGLSVALLGIGVGVSQAAPQTSTPVVVYANGMGGNWSDPAVRPGEVGFGALWDMDGMRWTQWNGSTASGTGQYWLGPNDGYRATFTLTDVQRHGSRRYFQDGTITARGHTTVHLYYGGRDDGAVGPSVRWWQL
jgi:hypothetical protein